MPKQDDILFGAHSGIQKAIRRGDLDLAKTCFDLMWPEKAHQSWLRWRIAILVEEEAWWLVGELAKFLKDRPESEKEWRKFIYQLVICRKAKDSGGLFHVAKYLPNVDHPEVTAMRKVLAALDEGISIEEIASETYENVIEAGDFSDYEKAALSIMRSRANMGGMLGDRICCVATMILIGSRGLDEKEVQKQIAEDFQKFKERSGKRPKKLKELPWYVYDMHTAKGKWALNILAKKQRDISKDELQGLWFHMVSAVIPFDQIVYVKPSPKPSPLKTVWWQMCIKHRLSFGNRPPKENLALWRDNLATQAEKLVLWCLEKGD